MLLTVSKERFAVAVDHLSPAGLAFLKRHEGFRSHLYNDSQGHATIGYGHLVHRGRVGTDPNAEFMYAGGLAEAPASLLLARDLKRYEAAVRTFISRGLQQHEFDALVSFTYNVGVKGFAESTLCRRVNGSATPDAIEAAFMMWTKNPELRGRRRDEVALYNHGEYGGARS
jgi:lysozyme